MNEGKREWTLTLERDNHGNGWVRTFLGPSIGENLSKPGYPNEIEVIERSYATLLEKKIEELEANVRDYRRMALERDTLRAQLSQAKEALEKVVEYADDNADSFISKPAREALSKLNGVDEK